MEYEKGKRGVEKDWLWGGKKETETRLKYIRREAEQQLPKIRQDIVFLQTQIKEVIETAAALQAGNSFTAAS